jgi:endonuclease/exonuclease/phosphatase family metal-dependent hydrolase
MWKLFAFPLAGLAVVGSLSLGPQSISRANITSIASGEIDARGTVSVLTYNIKGLPWPVATGRTDALEKIGERLAEMRARGTAPNIVVLQEGFTGASAAIQHQGGYKYAVSGPEADYTSKIQAPAPSREFAEAASPFKGETEGKYVSSGLHIFSDFPIVSVKRVAFPQSVCAGFDCLANKGILAAWVKIPSYSSPIAIVDTHLNSRLASGVGTDRADTAWAMQAKIVMQFIQETIPVGSPVIFAGDFNTGQVPARIRVINEEGGFLPGGKDALRLAVASGKVRNPRQLVAARSIINRAKDWQWFRSGDTHRLSLIDVSVPFGTEPDGSSLSDHFGYIGNYSLAGNRFVRRGN